MNLWVNNRVRIEKDLITHITRSIPGKGKITMQIGQEVGPEDLIGKSQVSASFRAVNLAISLGVSAKEAKGYLQRQIGQKIYKGELLAAKPGGILSGKKNVTAPTDGIIDYFDDQTGELRISFIPKQEDIPSAVYGVVDQIDLVRGEVKIRTQVTKIHGVLGSGKVRDGVLEMISTRDILSAFRIKSNYAERILVGGSLVYKDAVSMAVSLGVAGIIVGGINAKDFKTMSGGRINPKHRLWTDIGLTILVTEGFGSIPIGEDISKVLTDFKGRFGLINGNQATLSLPSNEQSCMIRIRKTKLAALGRVVEGVEDQEAISLKINQIVRVIGTAYLGSQGKVISIDKVPSLLPSGIRTYLLVIETKSRKIKVPYANVEVIGEDYKYV